MKRPLAIPRKESMGAGSARDRRRRLYLHRRSAPSIEGVSDQLADLQANRSKMLAWLKSKKERERIAAEYIDFKQRWSPLFSDAS